MLVKNNEKTVEYAIQSVLSLDMPILIGDLGCNDQTIDICRRYKTEIVKIAPNNDFSKAKNNLIEFNQSKWILSLEPYEVMLNGFDNIKTIIHSKEIEAYRLNILNGDIISKQIRIWNKEKNLKFKNPVFEILSGDSLEVDACLLQSSCDMDSKLHLAKKWLENSPLSIEPIYYTACCYLTTKNWASFLDYANSYLHQEKGKPISSYMIRYYSAMVQCYINKNYQESAKSLLPCIADKPLMAEFWCLLGDIYFATNQYDKAICFYENAIILGSRRLKTDEWPMEISKYKEYPENMIKSCKDIKSSSKIYLSKIHIDNLDHSEGDS